ncbi:MAG: sugar ABC transporter substrate-binding protein [Tissierellia bacterium]|nr:sugar ABC transporter substrate-binding protein [Tissierellia bacterium]
MKFTKKLLAAGLSASMLLSFAACGSKNSKVESDNQSVEQTGLKGEITVQAEKEWLPYYEKAAKTVMQNNPDSKIEIKEIGSFDNLDTLDTTDPTNEDIPDIFAIPLDRVYGLVEKDSLAAVNSEAIAKTAGGFENFNEGLGQGFKIADKEGNEDYFAFPMSIECLIVYENTKNAEDKNVDLSKPSEFTELTNNEITIPVFDAWYGVSLLNSADINLLEKSEDGKLSSDFTKEWKDLEPEKQKVVEAIYNYWKQNNEKGTSLFDKDAGYAYTDDAFATGGEAVYRVGGAWDYNAIAKNANDGKDLKIAPLSQITVNNKPLQHWKGGWGYAINVRNEGDEDKMNLCQAMIAELANPDNFEEFFKTTGKIMENVSAEKYENSSLADSDKETIKYTIESYNDAVSRPLFTEYGQVWDTYQNALLSWNQNKPKNAEEAYKDLKSSFDSMMSNIEG